MLYKKNIDYITLRFPHLVPLLENPAVETEEEWEVEVCQSKSGLPVPRIHRGEKKVYLNSFYDPLLEAQRWAANVVDEKRSVILLYGTGFFYHLRELFKTHKYKKVICYEPSIKLLRAALNVIDFTELGGYDWQLLSGVNYQEILYSLSAFFRHQLAELKVEILPSYSQIFTSEIQSFNQALRENLRITLVNIATSNAAGERWILNAVENLKHAIRSPGVRHFFNAFKGIPGIVISGGPSLEKNIHLLQGMKEKAVLICAGSSVRAAKKNGITPHFLVNIDGNPFNSVLYNEMDLSNVFLLYNIRSYPDMLNHYKGPKIHMKMDVEQFSDMLSFKSGGYDYGTIRSGFSCAHSALDFAYNLGCSPVILIGQDLAYTNKKRYADGQAEQAQKFVGNTTLPPGFLVVKDINGEDVITDFEFQNFKTWFERMVELFFQDLIILNATEGGQPIKGIPNRPLAEVLEEYCCENRGISWKVHKYYEHGQKQLKKYGPKALCIPSQIEILMDEGISKIEELMVRLQEVRLRNYTEEFNKEKWESFTVGIMKEYESLLNYREYEVLLVDLNYTKISANVIKIHQLGRIEDKETYDTRLVHLMNVLNESKAYLEKIRETNRKSLVEEADDEHQLRTNGKAN